MVNATNKVIHRVFVGRTEEKLAAVAAARSPYFFFEAETEDEALQIAQRALNFYFEIATIGQSALWPVGRERVMANEVVIGYGGAGSAAAKAVDICHHYQSASGNRISYSRPAPPANVAPAPDLSPTANARRTMDDLLAGRLPRACFAELREALVRGEQNEAVRRESTRMPGNALVRW